MYIIAIKQNIHNWEKQNIVSEKNGHDTVKCSICGLIGKRTSLETITVSRTKKNAKILNCIASEILPSRKIIITTEPRGNNNFKNLKLGSHHDIVEPDVNNKNTTQSVWVQGVEQKVRLLPDEFEFI
jgi:hypothetical protein